MIVKKGGQVCSALVTMAVADWSTYAVNLPETPSSSYRYLGSLTGIPAGDLTVEIYLQAGASPAITDSVLASGATVWDGSTVTSTTPTNTGKSAYLTLVNKVLKRITQPELGSNVSTATGQARIIAELINEAQNELWAETTNWHTLYTTRTFPTVASTATYALADDWGRTIDLLDTTNNIILYEDNMRAFDEQDPNSSYTGQPTSFAIQGSNYLLFPIPASVLTIRERYWKVPAALSADTDVSSLPLFCENYLIHWAWMSVLRYLQKYEAADRVAQVIYGNPAMKDPGILQKAKSANDKIINTMFTMGSPSVSNGIAPPRLGSHYGRMS
jgi:hypothetical protein